SAPQRIGVDGALRSHGYALAIGQDRAGAGKELAVPARRLAAVGPDEDVVTVDDDPDRHAVRHPFRRAGLDVDFAGAVQECKRRARKAQAAPGSGGPAIATAERSGGRNERAVSTTWSRVTARSSLGYRSRWSGPRSKISPSRTSEATPPGLSRATSSSPTSLSCASS